MEKELQHSSANAFILCILSHGTKGSVSGVDGKPIDVDKIMSKFDGNNCPALSGKPKVFIIQACQGCKYQIRDVECRRLNTTTKHMMAASRWVNNIKHTIEVSQR